MKKAFIFLILFLIFNPEFCQAAAPLPINHLTKIIARLEGMRQESLVGIERSEATMLRAETIVTLAREKGQKEAEAVARKALKSATEGRQQHLSNKSMIEVELGNLYSLRGREGELQQAEQRLTELRDDVGAMQLALKLYRDGLLQNMSSLDRRAHEVGAMSDKILMEGIDYLRDSATLGFLKSNFKFSGKSQYKKYEDFIELVEQLKTEKDILSWLDESSTGTTKLIEGADLLAGSVIPQWDHVKMNFRAWSTVAEECVAWRDINRYNRETDDYSRKVKAISLRMKTKVKEINCLKQCMAESIIGCTQKCSR